MNSNDKLPLIGTIGPHLKAKKTSVLSVADLLLLSQNFTRVGAGKKGGKFEFMNFGIETIWGSVIDCQATFTCTARWKPLDSAQGYQKGIFETDYFTLRNWALNLQT